MRLRVREYVDEAGRSPFRTWLDGLDVSTRARVQARVLRFELGNLGDHKSIGAGVWEARLAFGPGYRIYFGKVDSAIVLLLGGGDKASQSKDIRRARRCWEDFVRVTEHDQKK